MALRWRIEWHQSLDSTMTRARELAEAGAPAGTVIVADYQTEGRGTHGRTWLVPPGAGLMFTIVSRLPLPPSDLDTLPRRVSETIASALHDAFALPCTVKEPNDIYLRGRKLCGVLCQSHIVGDHVEWILCGIGLNTHMTADQLPLDTATSLSIAGVEVPHHDALLKRLLEQLEWLIAPAP